MAKTTTYRCDRCGAQLGEDSAALERTRFCTQERIIHRFKFFRNWKGENREPVVYELCEGCRDSLDEWLMGIRYENA